MLDRRITTLILLVISLGLVLFIFLRSGSATAPLKDTRGAPILISPVPNQVIKPDTLVLNDFEIPPDLVNVYRQGGHFSMTLELAHATHGQRALFVDKKRESNIEVATTAFPRDWQGYDRLEMDVYLDDTASATLWVRMGNQFDSKRFYAKSQKFARSYPLHPGPNTISIPFDDIRRAFGQIPQYKSLHFNIPVQGGTRLYFDYLRLVRNDD